MLSHRSKEYVGSLASLLRLSFRRAIPLDRESVRRERLKSEVLNILHRTFYRNVSILSQATFSTEHEESLVTNKFVVPRTRNSLDRYEHFPDDLRRLITRDCKSHSNGRQGLQFSSNLPRDD